MKVKIVRIMKNIFKYGRKKGSCSPPQPNKKQIYLCTKNPFVDCQLNADDDER